MHHPAIQLWEERAANFVALGLSCDRAGEAKQRIGVKQRFTLISRG